MNDIIYDSSGIIELLKEPIIVFICLLLVPLIVILLKHILVVEESSKKDLKRFIIIITCIIVLFYCLFYSGRFIYTYDIVTNNIEEKTIVLPKVSINNAGMYFIYDNIRYGFPHDEDKTIRLKEYFVGKECEITYYKFSKAVIKFRIIDH